MYAYLLSKENLELSRAEALSLSSTGTLAGNVLLSGACPFERLALTHYVLDLYSVGKNLDDAIGRADWPSRVSGSYFIDSHIGDAQYLAKRIWHALENPRIDSKSPKHRITIIESGGKYFIGEIVWKNEKSYMKRRAHLRPGLHPSSLHPKLARSCINLLGPKAKHILDPFCGTCGILIEGSLMGLNCTGYDISETMLRKGRENLQYFSASAVLRNRDALAPITHRYIVTDLPYGRNTTLSEGLYEKFLKNIIHVRKAVIIFPDVIPRRMLRAFRVKGEFSVYVHKSLTRRIVVLEGKIK
jgi:tRNA (guanine10-N2)-dimethyltransferase